MAAQLIKQITTAPLRTFRTRDLDAIYTQPNVQLYRLVQQGLVRRVAHGIYYSVPDDKPDTWVPTVEALGAGVATALFGEQVPVLMHLTAARLHGALPRAIGQVFVAAPKQHRPVQLHDIARRDAVVVFIQRKVDELDAVLLGTDLGDVLVTTVEQTVLDLAKRPLLGEMPDECQTAIRGLLPRCDDETLAALARGQRMQQTLDRVMAENGQARS